MGLLPAFCVSCGSFRQEEEMNVKVLQLGRTTKEVEVGEASTVGDVLGVAKLEAERHTLMVNGSQADMDQEVQSGDVVTLAPNVQGG